MKVFVTGATGFIGARLVECLSDTEHQVVCLARSTSVLERLQALPVSITIGDIRDAHFLVGAMRGCDWLVHLASSFEFWVPDRRVYREVNVEGVRNVMQSALQAHISKVIHVSTAAVYGNAPWPITEDTPFGTYRASEYAQTKFDGDMIAWRMYEEQGLPLVVIYPSAVIGPNDPKAAGRYLKNFALGRMPAQVLVDTPFPWVHVDDVCQAIHHALEKQDNIGEKYIVSACNMTFGEMNHLICEEAASRLPFVRLPEAMTVAGAKVLTAISGVTRRRPLLDLSVDQIDLMRLGYQLDGSKAERELGLVYTPIREAVAQAVASMHN
jgi:dihydroflavonol-4-reductase